MRAILVLTIDSIEPNSAIAGRLSEGGVPEKNNEEKKSFNAVMLEPGCKVR